MEFGHWKAMSVFVDPITYIIWYWHPSKQGYSKQRAYIQALIELREYAYIKLEG
jgi:hypothetical protein